MYEQGIRTSEGRGSGAFMTSRGTIGIGATRHSSRSSSLATDRNAPPSSVPPSALITALCGLALTVMISVSVDGFLNGLFWIVIGTCLTFGVSFYLAIRPNSNNDAALRAWENQWYCRTCGETFVRSAVRQANEEREPYDPFISDRSVARTRQAYIDRVVNPIQRARSPTSRDLAGLRRIRASAGSDFTFHPEALALDLGIASRLASLRFISYVPQTDRFSITKQGLEAVN